MNPCHPGLGPGSISGPSVAPDRRSGMDAGSSPA